MDEKDFLIGSFKYNRSVLAAEFSEAVVAIVDKHAAMFNGQTDFSLVSFDSAWDMVCHEAGLPPEVKVQVESFLMTSGTYKVEWATSQILAMEEFSREIEGMAAVAMG